MEFDPKTDFITRREKYLTVMAGNSDITRPDPITREEKYLAAMCDGTTDYPEPITRYEMYQAAICEQIASGGGGGLTLLASKEYEINTTSTSSSTVDNIDLPYGEYGKNDIVWVHIRDKAGKRDGYYYGSDVLFFSFQLANGGTNSLSVKPVIFFKCNSEGKYAGTVSEYGVWAYSLSYTSSYHYVQINKRYNSTTGTINGTFKVDVYKLSMPDGFLWDAES